MVLTHRTLCLICLAVFALVVGCSGGGEDIPMSPEVMDNEFTGMVNHEAANNDYIWETGEIVLDVEAFEATIIPLRTADFTLNIVKFLQPPAGSTSNLVVTFDLPNCNIPNAYVDLDVTLKHPFPGTAYWGFDTRVIVFAGGSTTGIHDTTLRYPSATELRMVNADGYTRWFNYDEFGPINKIFGYTPGVMAPSFTTSFSKVNGYKYYATGITAQQMPPNPAIATRGSFSTGQVTREMKLQFPKVTNPFKFKYSIATGWEAPTTNPPTQVSHFGPGANQQEAYQIVVTQDPASTAFYNPDNGQNGGDLILSIEVWDWQAAGNPGAQIGAIWLESPTLMNFPVEIKGTWTTSPGSSANSIIYSGTLTNLSPDAVTGQELFITVESASPTTYQPPLTGFLYPAAPLAAYQLYQATILDYGTPPVKSITVTSPNGGETLIVGNQWNITWTWTGAITNVLIEYDTNGGAGGYPNTIVASTPCDGSFMWTPIPNTPTTNALLRITEAGASPEAQDVSNAVWTISSSAQSGWNPIPGQIGMPITPQPNQSTVTPDLGIQNDDAGAEGAWMIDQAGGMMFFDYTLDWSGSGGNAYPSKFNYNFAPMGRHDVSSNGVAIFGCSANTNKINPPSANDPITCIWYISFLLADHGVAPTSLYMVQWGDYATPPAPDPDAQPWFHTLDTSGGIPGWQGDKLQDSVNWIMCYSKQPGAPAIPQANSGHLFFGFWRYDPVTNGYLGTINRFGVREFTTDNKPAPPFEAFDVSDPSKCRIGADTDSYLTFGEPYDELAVFVYLIDSKGNWYGEGYQVDWNTDGSIAGIGAFLLANCLKMRPEYSNGLYLSGGTAVDLEVLPTTAYLYDNDWTQGFNWNAVLYNTGDGKWVVRVYDVDWTAEAGSEITIVDTTDPLPGIPLAIDVDPHNFTIHVLANDGGTIKATVFDYTP